ncbi:MAG: alpha/beta fold hydrolase, partial [Chloroflexota bacterium]
VVAQLYAAANPDRTEALVLDAPIDRTLPMTEFWVEAAKGFEGVLATTLSACSRYQECQAAVPDAGHALDRIRAAADADGRISAEVTGTDGVPRARVVSMRAVEATALRMMYDQTGRMLLLRALAGTSAGDLRRLVRLVDVEGGGAHAATFAYFATWCADVRAAPGHRTDDFTGYVNVAAQAGIPAGGARDIAWATAACVFWPGQPAGSDPPPEATTVPSLILTATEDPITPPSQAHSVLDRLPDARLVETQGGDHGSLGAPCPNEFMADFLAGGRLPYGRISLCDGSVVGDFVPLAPTPARGADDAVLGLVWEIVGAPEVVEWSGTYELKVGCGDGGRMTIGVPGPDGRSEITFEQCSWAAGAVFDGTGTMDLGSWDADLALESPRGSLTLRGRGESRHVTGTWDGARVDLEP